MSCSTGSARRAIVLFGGLAKDRPYPGSTTVSTVNGGVVGMVRTLVSELAPIRINALHPGIVGDSPFWSGKNLDHIVARTPTEAVTEMADIVDARAVPAREPCGQRHRPARRRRLDDDVSTAGPRDRTTGGPTTPRSERRLRERRRSSASACASWAIGSA